MILYTVPVSLYCAKTRILLRHKRLTWTEQSPKGGYGSAEFKTIVPSGNLPALDDNGLLLGDSEAIAEYINEAYPEPPMLSVDLKLRAKERERGRFHDTRLEPALRLFFPLVGRRDVDAGQVVGYADGLNARLDQLSHLLTPDAGAALTIGDCGFEPTFMWIDRLARYFPFDVSWPDAVAQYRARLAAQEAVRDEVQSYQSALDPWIDAKTRERG